MIALNKVPVRCRGGKGAKYVGRTVVGADAFDGSYTGTGDVKTWTTLVITVQLLPGTLDLLSSFLRALPVSRRGF